MDPHEKGAVLIACELPTKLRGLLQLMLFTLAPIGAAEFAATIAAIAAAAGVSESTARRHLSRLAELHFIVITNNGAIGRRGAPPRHLPNSYRLLSNAERAAEAAAEAAEAAARADEIELLHCQIDSVQSSEERKIPLAGTGDSTAREPEGKALTNREEPRMWQTKPVSPEVLALLRQQLEGQRARHVEIATPTAPVRTDSEPIDSQPWRFKRVGDFCGSFSTRPPTRRHVR
jgi:hypothetical protein